MSTFDLTHDPKPTVIRRLEVITDVGGRRKCSVDAKAEIMLEALQPDAPRRSSASSLIPPLFAWLPALRRLQPDRSDASRLRWLDTIVQATARPARALGGGP